ncbi:glycosyltransferase [Pricia sp. S334]|uniref:Glycosyltransferase n=1 Tax=Pricia mediterranea TaxID=3076079 RepID=A0ABU3L4Q7_9FLAO|nr:glycosyltransferase [Pricia sp. S334]MDT7828087.1 glycosyltransferase [Pricia sp. S334]
MKIYFLSSSAFSDNQMSILKYLGKYHEITYAVIIPYKNSNYTKKELAEYCKENNIHFIPFELNHRFRDPRLLITYFSIVRHIRNSNTDLIYFANFGQLYLNTLIGLLNPSRTIIALHDVKTHSNSSFGRLTDLSNSILIEKFWNFQTFSKIQKKLLHKRIPHKTVYTISLPLIDFGALPDKKESNNEVNFLFFGNIIAYKGLDILLKAFKNIEDNHKNARLVIAGRCDDWEETYVPIINGSDQVISNIRFIANEEIPFFFEMADYVVLPYRDTTQSGPLMISYNYNKPVLVSNAEGFIEFTEEGVTGYSYDLSSQADLEQVLKNCMEMSAREYKKLRGRLANYTQANYSTIALVNKYNTMFAEVLAAKSH